MNSKLFIFGFPASELGEGIFKDRFITAAVGIVLKQKMKTRYEHTINLAGMLKGILLKCRIDKEPEI